MYIQTNILSFPHLKLPTTFSPRSSLSHALSLSLPPSPYQDSKRSAEIVPSPSLDVFLPEDEDNPYESVTTAVTRKPCSLDIGLFNACPLNGKDTPRPPVQPPLYTTFPSVTVVSTRTTVDFEYILPVKGPPTYSRVLLYFYYFLHCRIIVKT